jgi:PPM family protein phosphatase
MKPPDAGAVDVAALTHIGKVRRRNEDCIAVADWITSLPMGTPRLAQLSLDAPLACLVLDGMGGHAGGDVASRLAAAYLAGEVPACDSEAALACCIRAANGLLYTEMQKQPRLLGMGATLAGVRVAREGVMIFNVGDSRVYRSQDGALYQLSTDDVPSSGFGGGRSGMVTQSLGGGPVQTEIEPHIVPQPSAAGQSFLLCSDGLYDKVPLDAMAAAIEVDLGASVSRLFELAMSAGAADNVSIVLLRLGK